MKMVSVYSNAFWIEERTNNILRDVVTTFKEFIHKFLEVYFDDLTIFGLLKDRIENMRLMLEKCREDSSDFIEPEEMYFLCTLWNLVGTCSMKTRNFG